MRSEWYFEHGMDFLGRDLHYLFKYTGVWLALAFLMAACIAVVLVALTVLSAAVDALRSYRVRCPVDGAPARVHPSVSRAIGASFGRSPHRIRRCTRWPDHARCDQGCREQLIAIGVLARVGSR